jgi:hypothetical protein
MLLLMLALPLQAFGSTAGATAVDVSGTDWTASGRTFPPAFYARYRPRVALDMVLKTPGFTIQSGSSSRGLDGALGNVLINGVRPPAKVAPLTQLLAAIPAEDVTAVVLLRAGVMDIDMAGHDVLLNLVTASRETVGGVAGISGQSNGRAGYSGSAKADLRTSRPRRSFAINAQAARAVSVSEGRLVSPLVGQAAARRSGGTKAASRSHALSATRRWDAAAGGGVQLRVNASRSEGDTRPLAGAEVTPSLQSSGVSASHSGDVAAEAQWPLAGPGTTLSLSALVSRSNSASLSRIQTALVTRESSTSTRKGESAMRTGWRWKISDAWDLHAGLDYANNYLEGELGYRVDGIDTPVPGSASQVSERRGGLLATLAWRPNPNWTWAGGLRGETSVLEKDRDPETAVRYSDLLPNLSGTWQPMPHVRVGARTERKLGQLAFSQFLARVGLDDSTVTAGARALSPEISWLHSLDYEQRFGERGLFSLRLARNATENPIAMVVLGDGLEVMSNAEPAVVDTVEVHLSAPLDGIGVAGGLLNIRKSEAWSRTTDPVTGEHREVSSVPRGAMLALSQELPEAQGAWGVSLSEGTESIHYGVRQVARMRGEAVASVFGEWIPHESLLVRLSYSNARRSISDSWLYGVPRRAGIEADLHHVESSQHPPVWDMRLEWEPDQSYLLGLGITTAGDTQYVSQTIRSLGEVLEHSILRTYPTISTNMQFRW